MEVEELNGQQPIEKVTANAGEELKKEESSSMEATGNVGEEEETVEDDVVSDEDKVKKHLEDKLTITPKKALSPKHTQKKLDSETKKKQKLLEREERERKKQEEKEMRERRKTEEKEERERKKNEEKNEKLKQKQEREEQKNKEKEMKEEVKRKEKEEKELKRKEKEEKEEQKRKEKEMEKLKKQQELDEKNKEKQKLEEQNKKTAAAFVKFFKKKSDNEEKKPEDPINSKFMPFEVKSDMKLPPPRRSALTIQDKQNLDSFLETPNENMSYIKDLKLNKPRKSIKTWPYEDGSDDIMIIEEDLGESICEDRPKLQKFRVKFLKFHANRRPPYYGTWRKKSGKIKARNPLVEDKDYFDYEVDSDEDWEEEEQGESLNGSDDEDKENDGDNDDYEVDNEFFVPHGHLSDDEIDDEATGKLSPEAHKQKLKLLKDEFDQDMQTKTNKIKPRSIGCIWYNKDGSNVDEAIDRFLRPLAMITNGQVIIKKRSDFIQTPFKVKSFKEMKEDLIPPFLKMIHGNVNKAKVIVADFMNFMQENGINSDLSKANLGRNLKNFAQWRKCLDNGPVPNKFCWIVHDNFKEKYNVDF